MGGPDQASSAGTGVEVWGGVERTGRSSAQEVRSASHAAVSFFLPMTGIS